MTPRPLIGTVPHLPGWLGRWDALTGSMPGERLAALRIAAGLLLLLDQLCSIWPMADALLSAHSLTAADPYAGRFDVPHLRWSISRLFPGSIGGYVTAAVATLAAIGLITGLLIRISAVAAYLAVVSQYQDNPLATNGGDLVRTFLFLIVAVAPAVRWGERVSVPRWPATLILMQLAVMYAMNGINKLPSPAWRDGWVMVDVFSDLNWSLVPGLAGWFPAWATKLMTWTTLAWEVLFPLLILTRRTRNFALVLGVVFHVGTLFTLAVGLFPLYSLCLYVPFVPWERFTGPSRS